MPPINFSIITPSFNQARFIEQNIKSVLDQNRTDFEHIIVDGGSTDGTLQNLEKYPHLKWTSEPDRGQSHALNKGFIKAQGEIIGWLNSDDYYCPGIFTSVAEKFRDKKVIALCGDGYEVDEQGSVLRPLSSAHMEPEELIRYWKWRYEFVQPALFFRRSVFDSIGYLDESLNYAMDYDFFIRLGRHTRIHYIPQPLANLRMYPESKTGKNAAKVIPAYIREMQKVSKKYWGSPLQSKYYGYALSLTAAVMFSVLKNLSFSPTSKSRDAIKRFKGTG